MHTFLHTYRTELTLAILSLAVGTIAFLGMYARAQSQGIDFVTLTGDASGYITIATNILEHQAFSFSISEPLVPDSFRAPGYPVILALLFALFQNWLVVLVVQMVLVSSAPVLVYLLFKPYYEQAAWWAALIFIFEPVRLFLSASLLSDALFLCLLLLSLVALDYSRRTLHVRFAVYAGLLLGVCILMRPIAQFLPPLYAGFLLFSMHPRSRAWKASVLVLLAVCILTVPWMVRNHRLFNSWQLSSVGSVNLMVYNAPAYLAYRPDARDQEVLESFNQWREAMPSSEAISLTYSDKFTHSFREIVRGHEISYTVFHVLKTIPFFLTDGLRDTIRLFNVDIGVMPNISTALLKGNISQVVSYVTSGGLPIFLLLVGSGFWSVVTLLFLYALPSFVRNMRLQPVLVLCMALVVYFALLTGPVSSARYRLPVSGFLLFGAMYVLMKHTKDAYASTRT